MNRTCTPQMLRCAALASMVLATVSSPMRGTAYGEAIAALSSRDGKAVALASQAALESGSISRDADHRQRAVAGSTSESLGLELARRHLQELLPVLNHLRTHSPQQYEKAIRDLDRSAKKLESIRRRDAELYAISLREWQLRGQIDLLKARLRVKKSPAGQQEMLQRLQSLREAERDRIERELALIDEREAAYKERIEQIAALIRRGESLREQLSEQRQRLESESIDKNSTLYLKAIGAAKNDPPRAASSSKPKSKKATHE